MGPYINKTQLQTFFTDIRRSALQLKATDMKQQISFNCHVICWCKHLPYVLCLMFFSYNAFKQQ